MKGGHRITLGDRHPDDEDNSHIRLTEAGMQHALLAHAFCERLWALSTEQDEESGNFLIPRTVKQAMNSPQSQNDAVGSIVSRYVRADTTSTNTAEILFQRVNVLFFI